MRISDCCSASLLSLFSNRIGIKAQCFHQSSAPQTPQLILSPHQVIPMKNTITCFTLTPTEKLEIYVILLFGPLLLKDRDKGIELLNQ